MKRPTKFRSAKQIRLDRNERRRVQRAAVSAADAAKAAGSATSHATPAGDTTGAQTDSQFVSTRPAVPTTVGAGARRTYEQINALRNQIKHVARDTNSVYNDACNTSAREVADNILIAYRCLEDASMRLGKALQALDGGASVYDKQTTVGA